MVQLHFNCVEEPDRTHRLAPIFARHSTYLDCLCISFQGKRGSHPRVTARVSPTLRLRRFASSQGDRKGRPYYATDRLAKAVYSRGGACPHPVTCLVP